MRCQPASANAPGGVQRIHLLGCPAVHTRVTALEAGHDLACATRLHNEGVDLGLWPRLGLAASLAHPDELAVRPAVLQRARIRQRIVHDNVCRGEDCRGTQRQQIRGAGARAHEVARPGDTRVRHPGALGGGCRGTPDAVQPRGGCGKGHRLACDPLPRQRRGRGNGCCCAAEAPAPGCWRAAGGVLGWAASARREPPDTPTGSGIRVAGDVAGVPSCDTTPAADASPAQLYRLHCWRGACAAWVLGSANVLRCPPLCKRDCLTATARSSSRTGNSVTRSNRAPP